MYNSGGSYQANLAVPAHVSSSCVLKRVIHCHQWFVHRHAPDGSAQPSRARSLAARLPPIMFPGLRPFHHCESSTGREMEGVMMLACSAIEAAAMVQHVRSLQRPAVVKLEKEMKPYPSKPRLETNCRHERASTNATNAHVAAAWHKRPPTGLFLLTLRQRQTRHAKHVKFQLFVSLPSFRSRDPPQKSMCLV